MKKEPSAVSTEDVRRRPHLRGTKNHGGIIGRLLLPTSFSPQNGGNDVTGGIDVSLMAALICLVILMVLLFVVCWFCERRRSASRREALTRVQARRQAAAEASADPKLRSKVLQALFPERTAENSGNLEYNVELKAYRFSSETVEEVSCSICLENFDPKDQTISGSCLHVYHRSCLLKWLQRDNHQDCPNCRQPMWEPEAYQLLESCIMEQEDHDEGEVTVSDEPTDRE